MENSTASKYTVSFGLSLAICSLINALLVVAKEKSPAVRSALKQLAGHHWIGHSLVVVVLFFFIGWLLPALNRGRGSAIPVKTVTRTAVAGIALGVVIIVGFYLLAD
jgi:hypothetical protein